MCLELLTNAKLQLNLLRGDILEAASCEVFHVKRRSSMTFL